MFVTGTPAASDISALRSSKASSSTSLPAARRRCATGIQNRVWYSARVVIRIVLPACIGGESALCGEGERFNRCGDARIGTSGPISQLGPAHNLHDGAILRATKGGKTARV